MPTTRDYYEVLSVERTADGEEIKRSYRRMAMKYHPDRNPGDAEAEGKFKECAEAYEVLSDDHKRAAFDKFGHAGVKGAAGGPAGHDFSRMNAEDIFSMFSDIFSGGGGFGGQRQGGRGRGGVARGYDLETQVDIDLVDVLEGVTRDVEFSRMDVCDTCTGSGAKPGTEPEPCQTCGGRGQVIQTGLGGMFRMQTACPHCKGRGNVIKEKCPDCHGKGRIARKRKLEVNVPAGIRDGQAIRVNSEGEPPPPEMSPEGAGVRGDLHVVVRVMEHDIFQRDGDHLVLPLPINFAQAALGSVIEVPTLDEQETAVNIPKGTQHGAIFRVHGAGLPNLRSGRRGDLVTIVGISVPKKLDETQERLLRELADHEGEQGIKPEKDGLWSKVRDFLGG